MDSVLGLDAILLARIQFAFTIVVPLPVPGVLDRARELSRGAEGHVSLDRRDEAFLRLFSYWVKIFAITFAMGVVSGIVMSYQFGTNWSVFSDRAGPIIGPLMAYEVLTAFFLEAGFLGIMLFGREKVGPALHMAACLMVAVGTGISAFWILSVNRWMQTPPGYAIGENGQFVPADWWAVIFNPSFPYRLAHTLTAAYLTTAFVVGGVGAWHLLRGRADNHGVRTMFSMAMWMAALVAPVQIVLGDPHGLNTLEHQPAKVMAMEGHFQSHPDGAPLILFGMPDQEAQTVRFALEIPKLGSLILKHALERAARRARHRAARRTSRRSAIVFWSFRVMVAIGFLMLARRPLVALGALAPPAVRRPLAAPLRAGHGAVGPRRGDRRLDHHRGRPPALGGLRRCCAPPRRPRRSGRARSPPRWSPSSSSISRSSAPASSTCCG